MTILNRLIFFSLVVFCGSVSIVEAAPRYVFIDGGAHKGETIEYFRNSAVSVIHPWEIFCFEPVPGLQDDILAKGDLTLIQKAIWISNGSLSFFAGGNTTVASIYENEAVKDRKNIEVPAIDFSSWIASKFTSDDFVWLKLDIEGSEYEVLSKMLADKTIDLVDLLFIEFHNTPTQDQNSAKELLQKIRDRGVRAISGNSNPNGNWFTRSQWSDFE